MLKRKMFIAAIAALLATPGIAYAWPWSWDMFDQSSYKAQEAPLPPNPVGSVPQNAEIRLKDKDSSAKLKNPFSPSMESIERGKARFAINCAACHGPEGKADGSVTPKLPMPPPDLGGEMVQSRTEGEIYYVITNGSFWMPSYGDAVSPEDRWHIVNYIKHSLAPIKPVQVSAPAKAKKGKK